MIMNREHELLLAVRNLTVAFGGLHALSNVEFDVYSHEVVAVVGENAAGKSTLAKVMAGVYQPTEGDILWRGVPTAISSPSFAHGLGIAAVFQDSSLCGNLSVTANMFLGRELARRGALSELEMDQIARETLEQLSAQIPSVRQLVSNLSGGQQQSVAVARALLGSPSLVILDEPTGSLSVAQAADVLNLVESMREMGLGVVLISHNIHDVQAVADRVVVLRHGRNFGETAMSETNYELIIAAITGVPGSVPMPERRGGRSEGGLN